MRWPCTLAVGAYTHHRPSKPLGKPLGGLLKRLLPRFAGPSLCSEAAVSVNHRIPPLIRGGTRNRGAGCCRPLTRPCMVKQTAHSHSRPATVDGHGSRVVWDHGCLHALRGLPPDTTCATARKHNLCTAPDTCLTQVVGEGTRLHPWRESQRRTSQFVRNVPQPLAAIAGCAPPA